MGLVRGFLGGSYQGANPVAALETCVNWYPSAVETPNGSTPVELLPSEGMTTVATASVAGGRAAWAGDGRCFLVFGDTLFELDEAYTLTNRGTVGADSAPATISTNGDAGNQLLITSTGNAYCFDLTTNTLTTVVTGDVLQGAVVDGYGVVFGAGQIRISDLFDLTTWDPTQFALRSIQSDLWQAMHVDPAGYITLFGSKTSESWANVGAFPFPFAPDRSGMMEDGIAAAFSIRQAGKHKVWLSTNSSGGYQVLAAQGFTPRRISTHAVEYAIAHYARVSDAVADSFEREGHAFYLLTFPSAGVTWVYDFSTALWHQRGAFVAGMFTSWRPAFSCHAFGRHLAVDRDSASVFALRDDLATEADGSPIVRERTFRPGGRENQRVFYDRLEIQAQAGVGLATGAAEDVDPHLMLSVSDDYGRTFGTERTASVGAIGDYGRRCAWWGLGSSHGRMYRLRASAGVPWRLTGAYEKIRAGSPLEAA